MKKINCFKYVLVITAIIFLNISDKGYSQNVDKFYEKIDLFSEVLEKIQNEYVDEIDQAETIDAAINGVLQSLDPYSAYMNPEVFKESSDETSGEFVKFNAKTEKDGPKALFYHIKGKEGEDEQKEITDSYQSLEGMIHRMYNA